MKKILKLFTDPRMLLAVNLVIAAFTVAQQVEEFIKGNRTVGFKPNRK